MSFVRRVSILTSLFSVCLLSVSVSGNTHPRCTAGSSWFYFNGWCYSLSDTSEGWFGSEKDCQRVGGELATIADPSENNFVQALAECNRNFWIGLVKTDVRNRKFSWWNDYPLNYTTPLRATNDGYSDCVYFAGSTGNWHNTYCQTLYPPLCKLPARQLDSETEHNSKQDQLTEFQKCPESWLPIEGKCYYVSSKKTNYFNAQISCEAMGATLATVNSRREHQLLTMALGCNNKVWIGLEKVRPCISEPSRTYCWMWSDGTELSFADWAPAHPSADANVECTYTQGRWYTTNCHYENAFVCMKK